MSDDRIEKLLLVVAERVGDADRVLDMLAEMKTIDRIAVLALVLAKVANATRIGEEGPANTIALTAALAGAVVGSPGGLDGILKIIEAVKR